MRAQRRWQKEHTLWARTVSGPNPRPTASCVHQTPRLRFLALENEGVLSLALREGSVKVSYRAPDSDRRVLEQEDTWR